MPAFLPPIRKLFCLGLFLLAFLPKGTSQDSPNVLFIISDDLNTRIGPYMDIETHTPNLNRLAMAGLQFSRAYCQYPLCGPSRASIMSGLYPETNGVKGNQHVRGSYRGSNPALADHPTLAGFFREQGYFTARVSKIFHMGVPGGIERGEAGDDDPDSWDYAYNVMGPETLSPGPLELLSPGNLHYGSNFARMILPNGTEATQTDYLATNQAIALLESRAAAVAQGATNKVKIKPVAPFFMAVGLVRPHVPFIAPKRCFTPYPTEEMEVPDSTVASNVPEAALRRRNGQIWEMDEQQKRQTIAAYMASVQFMDEQVGRLLETLDRLDLRQNTIVVFMSDHGYNLGEHDCWSKVSLWEGSVRVPLIIAVPEDTPGKGQVYTGVTELIDLYPTLVDLCGLSAKAPSILQGQSHAGFIRSGKVNEPSPYAYTITRGGSSIRSEGWRYTRWDENAEGENEELYDHQNDPEEKVNLVDDPNYQAVLVDLRQKWAQKRKQARSEQ
jgi:arylsulfatase A-like enzyme